MARIGSLVAISLLLAQGSPAKQAEPVPLVRVEPNLGDQYDSCPECESSVTVEFTVTEEGSVAEPHVVESHCPVTFTESALKAIHKWKYTPKVEHSIPHARSGVRATISCRKPSCTCESVNTSQHASCLGVIVLPENGAPPGVHLAAVPENTPAYHAGFQPFDVVIQFNSRQIRKADELSEEVHAARPGEGFEAIAIRGDNYITLSGVISERAPNGSCPVFDRALP